MLGQGAGERETMAIGNMGWGGHHAAKSANASRAWRLGLRVVLAAAVLSGQVAPALAGEPAAGAEAPESDIQRAKRLFEEATAHEHAGRWQEALERLQEVARIKTTPGVLFHIANCEEGLGRLADALRTFERAKALADAEQVADVQRLAPPRIEKLRERVPRLTLRLPDGVTRFDAAIDGVALPREQGGRDIPINPGTRSLWVRTPDREPFTTKVEAAEGAKIVVQVVLPAAGEGAATPPPAPAPATSEPTAPRPAAPEESPSTSERRGIPTGTWIAGAGALALAAGGVVAYAVAGSVNADGRESCARPSSCDRSAASTVQTLDRVALGLWIGAVAAGGAAVAILALDRPGPRAAARPAPELRAEVRLAPGHVALAGRF